MQRSSRIVVTGVDVVGYDGEAAHCFQVAVGCCIAESNGRLQFCLIVFSGKILHSWVFMEKVDVAVDLGELRDQADASN